MKIANHKSLIAGIDTGNKNGVTHLSGTEASSFKHCSIHMKATRRQTNVKTRRLHARSGHLQTGDMFAALLMSSISYKGRDFMEARDPPQKFA